MPSAAYYAKHKERLNAANRENSKSYAGRRKELNRAVYEADPGRAQRWRDDNPEHEREAQRVRSQRYYGENRDHVVHKVRTRAAAIEIIDELLPGEWEAMVEDCGNVCIVPGCGASPVTKDHVIPVSKGGRHHISNLQPLCGVCNSKKGVGTADYRGS